MSHDPLKYCCSNPACHHKFTVEEAKHEESLVQLSSLGLKKYHSLGVPLLHILCPKCNTIASSIHLPADVI